MANSLRFAAPGFWNAALRQRMALTPEAVLGAAWSLFIAGFFIAPDKHLLRVFFHILLVLTLLWQRRVFRACDWRSPLTWSLVATIAYLGASACWGVDADSSHAWRGLQVGLYLAGLFLVTRYLAVAGWLRVQPLLWGLVSLAAFDVALTLGHWLLAPGLDLTVRLVGLGQQQNPLILAGVLGACGLLALTAFYRTQSHWRAGALLVLIALMLVTIFLSQSRGPLLYFALLAVPVSLLHAQFESLPHLRRRQWVFAATATALIATALLWPAARQAAAERAAHPSYRPTIWQQVLTDTRPTPLFGQGWRADETVHTTQGPHGHAHNVLLSTYRFGGLIGLALFGGTLSLLCYRGWKLPPARRLPLLSWLLFGLACELTNGRFPLSAPSCDWFLLWLPAALIFAFDRLPPSLPTTAHAA